jgi:hypothetical protein
MNASMTLPRRPPFPMDPVGHDSMILLHIEEGPVHFRLAQRTPGSLRRSPWMLQMSRPDHVRWWGVGALNLCLRSRCVETEVTARVSLDPHSARQIFMIISVLIIATDTYARQNKALRSHILVVSEGPPLTKRHMKHLIPEDVHSHMKSLAYVGRVRWRSRDHPH